MTDFVLGGTAIGCLTIALFFLRFYRDTADGLFAALAAAFFILGVNRLILTIVDEDAEGRSYVYALRFLAFMLVVWGIVLKSRSSEPIRRGRDRSLLRGHRPRPR